MDIANLTNSLKQKQYLTIINSNEYKKLLTEMCKRIVNKSKTAANEATIENYFDCELFAFFKEIFEPLGFSYEPEKESPISTKRHTTKGRADSAIGALVIEFKQPSTLSNTEQQKSAIEQISNYILGLEENNESVGMITDGTKACFVIKKDEQLTCEPFFKLSNDILDRLIQYIINLRLTGLSSKNLVETFCKSTEEGIGYRLVKVLYNNLANNTTPKTMMLFNEWKELFNLSHDDVSKQQAIIDRRTSLENLLCVKFNKIDEEYSALFALQTAYAIIVKSVAYRILSIVRYKVSMVNFEQLINIDSEALRLSMERLEEGALFRDYGITNLLEGDFFSWYCSNEQWTESLAEEISHVFEVLSLYSDKAVLNTENKSADFFKELYQKMMPAAVRHSLGEYYTKKWIANNVVDEALTFVEEANWKGLDPCCGSGTFITVLIDKVLEETKELSNLEKLDAVLSRVKGIDLNPIAVLTARVNYFINISSLIDDNQELEIPIYLGDSSYVPQRVIYDDIKCLKYTINTLKDPINICMPESMVEDPFVFSKTMTNIELHIKNQDEEKTYLCLAGLANENDLTEAIKDQLSILASKLVELERNNWDGIWARIITNYLTTANLGKFDIIVGNPPWVDWKSLPSGYRDKIKSLCVSRKLFSGDRITGGINLNICALISNVVAENWLDKNGILGFLMPEPLIFQPSYEGFRNLYLEDGSRLYFQKFSNWTRAGHPFYPVTQKFLSFYISHKETSYDDGVDVDNYILKDGKNYADSEMICMDEYFDVKKDILATCHETKNIFSYVNSREELADFKSIAGVSQYIGREGIEFYPQELLIFTKSTLPEPQMCTSLRNIQVKKSKYHVLQRDVLLETKFLHPLIKGVDITPFHVNISGLIVPFPYDSKSPRLPIGIKELTEQAPQLANFYQSNKKIFLSQTDYNDRIIGKKGEFYALARVGAYSFAKHHVVFRDNTKWGAAVISFVDTDWGGKKLPLFQNHAVSICEDVDGNFITENEAHFICGIMNSPIAYNYVLKSSDSRSFPIRPRIYIPKYDASNEDHKLIVKLSKRAHKVYDDEVKISKITQELDELYLKIAKNR